MDPLSCITSVVRGLNALKVAYDTMEDNKVQSRRLLSRLEALAPALTPLQTSTDPVFAQSLRSLVQVVADCEALFCKFSEKTWFRLAEKWMYLGKYHAQYAGLNTRLTQIVGDLNLAASAKGLSDARQRRDEDMADQRAAMQAAAEEVLAQMRDGKEASEADLLGMQAELRAQYRQLMDSVLALHGHAPLDAAEAAALQASQEALLALCAQQFAEVLEGIRRIERDMAELVVDLHGVAGDIHDMKQGMAALARSSKRAKKLEEVTIAGSEIQVLGRMAAGGFGVVHLGEYKRDRVALKLVVNDDGTEMSQRQRLEAENEVIMMNLVAGPDVLHVYGLVHEPLRIVMVLELAPFGSLWGLLGNFSLLPAGALPPALQLAWTADLCFGVAHLHSKCVRHKDLKCQNLLVYASPNRLRVKICDFGLAKQSAGGDTSMNSKGGGTMAFMAPECRNGKKSSSASDVFSLAITVVQILTRSSPGLGQWDEQVGAATQLLASAIATSLHAAPAEARARALASLASVLGPSLQAAAAREPADRPSARVVGAKVQALLSLLGGDPRKDSRAPDYGPVKALEAALGDAMERGVVKSVLVAGAGQSSRASKSTASTALTRVPSTAAPTHSAEDLSCIQEIEGWLKTQAEMTPKNASRIALMIYDKGNVGSPKKMADRLRRDAGWLASLGVDGDNEADIKSALEQGGFLAPMTPGGSAAQAAKYPAADRVSEQAKKDEDERKAREAAVATERARAAQARKDEDERKAREAAAAAERARAAQAKKDEDERKATEAAAAAERARAAQAKKDEDERMATEAAAAAAAERARAAQAKKDEDERMATEAAAAAERARAAQAKKVEDERKAKEGATPKQESEAVIAESNGRYAFKSQADIAANRAKVPKTGWGILRNSKPVGKQIYDAASSGDMAALLPLVDEWFANDVLNWTNPADFGRTPLIIGTYRNKPEAVRLLLATPGVDVNKTTNAGYTAIICAAIKGHTELARDLLAAPGVDVNKADKNGITAIMYAAQGHTEIVRAFLAAPGIDVNKTNKDGVTALMTAAGAGNREIIRILLAAPGIDINKADKDGVTAIMGAADNGHIEVVRDLLTAPGIDVNRSDNHGMTAIIKATGMGHTEIVRALLAVPCIDLNHYELDDDS